MTFFMVAGIVGTVWMNQSGVEAKDLLASMSNVGGFANVEQQIVHESEQEIKKLRTQQSIFSHREEILRYQLRMIEEERRRVGNKITADMDIELRRSREMLLSLLRDQKEAEEKILTTIKQMWEAEGRVIALTRNTKTTRSIWLTWPVEPIYGLSADFHDEEYEEMFGLSHEAIDIPIEQGSIVYAAEDGVVEQVVDNGYGFNYVIIRHGGIATLYGHVQSFLVHEGQEVERGDPIAESGGLPGSPGAGALSTGPHLHFEVIRDGQQINPLLVLPRHEKVQKPRRE